VSIVENQAAVLFGVIFGAILSARVVAWIALLFSIAKTTEARVPIWAALFHSGPFAIVVAALITYFAVARWHETPAVWFLAGFAGAPIAVVSLTFYARRAGQRGPLSWVFAKRRNFLIFGYVTMAFIVSPYLWALHHDVTLALLAALGAIIGVHFGYWYMWQLVGPEIERVAALRRAQVDQTHTDTPA
jgi:hypothetical protein